MKSRILIKIALPMVAVSLLLLAAGITAAWHVQRQQKESSELIRREVHGLLAVEDVFTAVREIRRELDLYLRTHDERRLAQIDKLSAVPPALIELAKEAARTPQEQEHVGNVDRGYAHYLAEYHKLRALPGGAEVDKHFGPLCDELLSNEVLGPARECITFYRQVVDRTNDASQAGAQHVRVGFLLLGITGGLSGLLIGVGMARAVSRSIVQLDVRVRGVTGRLNEVSDPVQILHIGDLRGLEDGFGRLETQIGQVVRRLQQREGELQRSEQLAIAGQLAAGMAHEMRNPLMPIKVLVQSALSRNGELRGRQLQIVNDELIRLEESIQFFLDFTRPPQMQMAPLEIKEVIYQALDLAFPKAHLQEVELRCVIPSRPVNVLGDRVHLKQLLLNLLLNALDMLPDGGLIEVELDVAAVTPAAEPPGEMDSELDALRVISQDAPVAERFRIHVRDTGPGISPETLQLLFEPFFTTKETGTGLGLPNCRQTARAHGGEIYAANRRPHGAQLTLELPYAAAVDEPSPAVGFSNSTLCPN